MVLELFVGSIDRLDKLLELRCVFDGPDPIERRAQQVEIALRQQPNCDDAFLHISNRRVFIGVRNAFTRGKCLPFRLGIGLGAGQPLGKPVRLPRQGHPLRPLGREHLDDTLGRLLLVDAIEPVEMVRPA